MSIIALIPARNEPLIGLTVDSIRRQTLQPDIVVVVTNNCTDEGETAKIAAAHGAIVLDLGAIDGKKAGAMNAGLNAVMEWYPKTTYILQMDADTILDENFIARTYGVMQSNNQIGGLGASFIGQRKSGKGFIGKFLVWGQRQEFARFASGQLSRQTSVLSGTACLLRVQALLELDKNRGFVWSELSIVEDYESTKALQEIGWLCLTDASFIAYTDVMTTWPELFTQRLRWQRGTLQVIFHDFKGKRCARADAWRQRIAYSLAIPHILGYILIVIWGVDGVDFTPLIAIWVLLGLFNFWSTRKAGLWVALISSTVVPLELYNFTRYRWLWKSWRMYRSEPITHQQW